MDTPVTLVSTSCHCGDDRTVFILSKEDRDVVKCKGCGTIRTMQRAHDYETLYTEGDRYHVERQGHTPYRERYEHDARVGDTRIIRFHQFTRWLDVGTANGGFMDAALQVGYAVEGLELNPSIAAWAEEATQRPVHRSWNTVDGPFDVISYHDVFEHVVHPIAELHRARSYLKYGGRLILDVPDADDPRFDELGANWHHMKPLEHLWFWTEDTLSYLLQVCGFEIDCRDEPIPGKLVLYARRVR